MPPRPKVTGQDLLASFALAAAWVGIVRPGGLDLPFFWDEADVYVPGSVWVADHGLTVTPGVFPDDYSRGHPPLLYLIAGAAFAAFGASPAVGHLVVLPFTVAALALTYLLGAQLFGRSAGAAAALLLGATPLFMSMGNMLLPEMPLTALAVGSFFALSRGRVGVAAALGIGAVLMKETGIFAAAGVGAAVLFDARQRGSLRSRAAAARIAWAAAPLVALCLFFVWQKATAGYFVYPHHANLLADRPFDAANLVTVFPSVLVWHGRWVVLLGAAAAGLAGARIGGEAVESVSATWAPTRTAVLVGIAVVGLGNAAFFAKMFWLERYALPAHPLVLVALAGALLSWPSRAPAALRARPRWLEALSWLVVFVAVIIGAASMRAPTDPDAEEQTFGYADVIWTHRAALAEVRDSAPHASRLHVLTSWPLTIELRSAYLGYVRDDVDAMNVRYLDAHPGARFSHVVVNQASDRAEVLRAEAERRGMVRLSTHRRGVAPALEVWGRP